MLLMFAAGAEMRRLLQRDAARTVGLIASLGLLLPFAAGLVLVALLGTHGFVGTAASHTALILVFGMAVAVTSIPVISRIMHDVGLLGTRFARIVLSVAVIEDIVVYVVLAVAVGLVETSSKAFGLPTLLGVRGVTDNSIYHTVVAVVFLGTALRFGGPAYRALARMRANPLARRSPAAFQLLRHHQRVVLCQPCDVVGGDIPSRRLVAGACGSPSWRHRPTAQFRLSEDRPAQQPGTGGHLEYSSRAASAKGRGSRREGWPAPNFGLAAPTGGPPPGRAARSWREPSSRRPATQRPSLSVSTSSSAPVASRQSCDSAGSHNGACRQSLVQLAQRGDGHLSRS
jgi:hypothetical protein